MHSNSNLLAKRGVLHVTAIASAVSMAFLFPSAHAQTYFSIDSSNASVGSMHLNATTLGNAGFTNLSSLSVGSNPFNYATVSFVPTTTRTYTFGQTSAPVDTTMILYRGGFNPASPATGALVGNDDTTAALHQSATNNPALSVLCGNSTSFCPQVSSQVTAGEQYTLLVSTYNSGRALNLPLSYYADGTGTFSASGGTVSPPHSTVEQILTHAVAQVSAQSQRSTSVQQAVVISTMLSSISNRNANSGPRRMAIGGERGMAAGEGKSNLNAWVNVSDSNVALNTVFSGGVQNYIGGIDYALNDATVLGVSVGQDISKIDLFGTRLKNEATSVAPYISYQFNDTYSVDAALGYSSGDSKYSQGTTGTQAIRRSFSALNANGNWWFDDWQLSGKASYIESEEKLRSFVTSNGATISGSSSKLRQVRVGAQISYWANGIMPYAGVTLVRDLNNPNNNFGGVISSHDKEAINVAVGVNFLQGKELTGSVAYTTERSRANSKNDVFMASMSYRF